MKRIILLTALALLPVAGTLHAEEYRCPTVSAGVSDEAVSGSLFNVGQAVIGYASNGSISAHAGCIPAFNVLVECLLGDVNNDGLVDGADIDPFVRVTITGLGTPQELCAANLTVAAFVDLLINP